MNKLLRRMADLVVLTVRLHRWPITEKYAWTMSAIWAGALLFPLVSVGLNPARGLDLTIWVGWSNAICIILDTFMLSQSVKGLLWIRRMEKSLK